MKKQKILKNETQVTLSEIKQRQNDVKSEIQAIHKEAENKVKQIEQLAEEKLKDQISKRQVLAEAKNRSTNKRCK